MTSIVAAEGLSKTFQVKVRDPGLRGAVRALFRPRYRDVLAVRDVTFRIEPGEIVAFLGPNGAGKTTTLKMLAGLLYPTSGRVEAAGFVPWTGGPPFKRRIALVLGNRQHLVWDLPPLLFLDEPTLGLDVTAQEAIRRFLSEYRDRHGATVLLTSHYMQDVTALASRVLMINRGRLLYDGALEVLVARIARTKRIELVLGGGDGNRVTAETLAAFGEVKSFRFPNAVLEVRREDAPATSARLLAAFPVADLSIEDPPIEEVIRLAVARGAPALRPRALGAHGRGRAAGGRDAVLHQLHHGTAGVLDPARHRDHGAPCGRVPVPRR